MSVSVLCIFLYNLWIDTILLWQGNSSQSTSNDLPTLLSYSITFCFCVFQKVPKLQTPSKYINFLTGKRVISPHLLGSSSPLLLSVLTVNSRSCWIGLLFSTMATKMKGIYKGFKYISQIFGNAWSWTALIYFILFFSVALDLFCHFDGLWCLEAKVGNGCIAVVKEREMEIGYPTDVKHVAHIGWDGPSGSAPSWVCCPHPIFPST